MALDGIMLGLIKNELYDELLNSHINQIHQPSKDEIVINFRTKSGSKKLFMSCRADCARVHFTENAPENPPTPPMLCMLLRKRLCGARLTDIRQPQSERILFFDFEATNEIGDREKLSLCIEIMGRYSNIILIDEKGLVIDAIKRIDITMTREHVVLPKLEYILPQQQDKLSVLTSSIDEIVQLIESTDKPLDKAILSSIQGVSPIICRELMHRIVSGGSLQSELGSMAQMIKSDKCTPTLVFKEDGSPFDIAFMDITQYDDALKTERFDSFCALLDAFYHKRDMAVRMKSRSMDLHKLVSNTIERLSKKINIQTQELKKCADREQLRIKGDLLQANLYKIQKGAMFVEVENFYEEGSPIIRIVLDPSITPAQNGQKFYKAYAKAKTAEQMLKIQIEKAEQELQYMLSVQDFLSRATSDKELSQIRLELIEQGYIKEHGKGKQKAPKALPPLEFTTSDGFTVLVGRNNKQNDVLTLKTASKFDYWFHTKNIHGSHTIVLCEGREISDTAILEAAQICAYHSKGKDSSQVPVDYTIVKNVSKPSGAKPGKVIYVSYNTVYVTPKLPKIIE
ncbi:MAG: NFACT RNA binding domain-containing protein [Eubacteriales bacterium]|nr:NFACT RNA binding domain-containing protein [Eubacteriales bacterium]